MSNQTFIPLQQDASNTLNTWTSNNVSLHEGNSVIFKGGFEQSYLCKYVPIETNTPTTFTIQIAKKGTLPSPSVSLQLLYYNALNQITGTCLKEYIPYDALPNRETSNAQVFSFTTNQAPENTTQIFILINKNPFQNTADLIIDLAKLENESPAAQSLQLITEHNAQAAALSNFLYILTANHTLMLYDTSNQQIKQTIPLGGKPTSVRANIKKLQLYITTETELLIIDPITPKIVQRVSINGRAHAVSFHPEKNVIYVAATLNNSSASYIHIYNADTYDLINSIPINYESEQLHLAFHHKTNCLIITGFHTSTVSFLQTDTLQIIHKIGHIPNPNSITVHPTTQNIYITSFSTSHVVVLDSLSFNTIGNILVGEQPASLSIDKIRNQMYVVNKKSGTISVINVSTQQLLTTIPDIQVPNNIILCNGRLFVTRNGFYQLVDINLSTNEISNRISFSSAPIDFDTFDPTAN